MVCKLENARRNKFLPFYPFLTLLIIRCAGLVTRVKNPDFAISKEIGTMEGHSYICCDSAYLLPADREAKADFTFENDTLPEGIKIYWFFRDIDDPANDIVIDRNGAEGNDNIGYAEFAQFNDYYLNYEAGYAYTLLSYEGITGISLRANPYWGNYSTGDNWVVTVKVDLAGDSISSPAITLIKRLLIEYDRTFGYDIGSQARNNIEKLLAFSRDSRDDQRHPDSCVWFEIESGYFKTDETNLPDSIPRYHTGNEDSAYLDLKNFASQHHHDSKKMLHLLSIRYPPGEFGLYRYGISNKPDTIPKFSHVFQEYIADERIRAAAPVHELGHQIANLLDYPPDCTDYSCLMWGGIDPVFFCSRCIRKIRDNAFY